MRVELKTEGGVAHFPGLTRPTAIESDELDGEQAQELSRLVDAARFFELPDIVGSPGQGAADYQQHTVTIDDAGRVKSVKLVEPFDGEELHNLLRYLQRLVRSA